MEKLAQLRGWKNEIKNTSCCLGQWSAVLRGIHRGHYFENALEFDCGK